MIALNFFRSPLTISFCMIVRNGAKTLASCLESVAGLVDEMVVVDTGSSDGSECIARSFGARVIRHKWTGDFAAARNAYLVEARCDRVLSLDADEYLGRVNASEVRTRLRDFPGTAFVCEIRNYFPANEGPESVLPSRLLGEVAPGIECMVSRTIRLFPRIREVRYCYPIHESLIPSLRKQGVRIRSCRIPIHHVGYMCESEERRQKGSVYHELGLKKIAQYPAAFVGYLEIGNLLLHEKRFEEAEVMFRKSIRLRPDCLDAHLLLAMALLRQRRYSECRLRLRRILRDSRRNYDALHILSACDQLEPPFYRSGCGDASAFPSTSSS